MQVQAYQNTLMYTKTIHNVPYIDITLFNRNELIILRLELVDWIQGQNLLHLVGCIHPY